MASPPPSPRDENGKPKVYKIPTRGSPSWVTYSWVELGPQERRALNLDNAARTDSTRNAAWYLAKHARDKAAIQLPEAVRQLRTAAAARRPLLSAANATTATCRRTNAATRKSNTSC